MHSVTGDELILSLNTVATVVDVSPILVICSGQIVPQNICQRPPCVYRSADVINCLSWAKLTQLIDLILVHLYISR